MKHKIDILINTKDRPSELYGLLVSLRNQTFQNFDIWIMDDCGGTQLQNYHFINCIVNTLKAENHSVEFKRNNFNLGVSKSRQAIVEWSMEDGNGNLLCRIDDDVYCDRDYLEQLLKVIDAGYDLASGVTVAALSVPQIRETKFLGEVMNVVKLDDEGKFILNGDDCGIEYDEEKILLTPHFRSCALYKKEIHEAGVNYKSNLSKYGFREEEVISFKMVLAGFKLGINTKAVNRHLICQSGGERCGDANELTKLNEEILCDWTKNMVKKHGNFIDAYYKKHNVTPNDKTKTNLVL